MRLSPKSVFCALVVVGLPFAVVAGWALGAPVVQPATLGAADSLDGVLGNGGLGSAPHGAAQSRDSGYTARPPRATADPASTRPVPATGPSTVTSTVTIVATTTPSSAQTTDPPLLTLPPVPTPTFVTDPPVPSATPPVPSATDDPASSSPSGYNGPAGESRRWLWG